MNQEVWARILRKLDDWEIGLFDTSWKAVGIRAAAADPTQNTTPNGKSSALIEDANALDSSGKELDKTYETAPAHCEQAHRGRFGKSYNIYFKAKSENWVSPDTHAGGLDLEMPLSNSSGSTRTGC